MRWTAPFLIVLALLSLGCARGDWTTQTLTLADVTGTWEGPIYVGYGFEQRIRFVLQQNGPKVKGEVKGPDGASIGSVEGMVNGEILSWQMTGRLNTGSYGSRLSGTYRGEVTVNGDELSGRANGPACPCPYLLRRVNTEAIKEKQQM